MCDFKRRRRSMAKNLVIVESPAKAKTIVGYLGKDFEVMSSFGHIRDLAKKNNGVDIENKFEPTYEISDDKKKVVKDLKSAAKKAELVWLASDDDREGEAISWHLKEALDLDDAKTRRIVFREITKNAILNAIESPRTIDVDLVNAQQARRILDRLVGFELSPVLWTKVKRGLSAGRVQSVAVRLIVEREREINKFNSESSFKIVGYFDLEKGAELKAELNARFKTEEEAQAFLEKCKGADYTIESLTKKPAKKSPAPPFTTSTLQQEASRKLGYSVSRTMTLAQKLYESGKISYMRTDSVNLSDFAMESAKSSITDSYGEKYHKARRFKTKSAGAQEAHEAIRPTDFAVQSAGSDNGEQRLYDLIRKRAIASQMADAELEKTTAKIGISSTSELFQATGEVVKFDGFLKVYMESSDDDNDEEQKGMLPPLNEGQVLDLKNIDATERFTKHPARYTEASLVKKLEEMGIGRPSTYAPTISTIQKRGYVEKDSRDGKERNYKLLTLIKDSIASTVETEITGTEKNKMFPTDIALVVNDFLVDHFTNVVDYQFTARVEAQFDDIAEGKTNWQSMLDEFYGTFHEKVEAGKQVDRSEVGSSRELGNHPESGKLVIARLGRFGPMVQIGETSEDEEAEKPQFASLRKGQSIESITMEEALELFKLPRQLGEYEDKVVTAAIGRFGPYIRHDNKFVSIPKGEDPLEISYERGIELIELKREEDRKKFIKSFPEDDTMQVLNGRYGPYIKHGKKNVKIPKDKVAEDLTYEECVELSDKTPEKKGRGKKKK